MATWNVNSVKQRVGRLLPWLDERGPDVVCLQETKLTDEAFAELLGNELGGRGYEFATYGEAQWNGVAPALAGRAGGRARGVPGAPASPSRRPARWRPPAAGCGSTASTSPTGGFPTPTTTPTSSSGWRRSSGRSRPSRAPALVCGDMNIAPADADVFDPAAYEGHTHVTPAERAALQGLLSTGLHDVIRERWPDERVFTYWDYRAGMFHQDLGMRIDLVLACDAVSERVRAAWVDRQARKGSRPSDHAPVIVDLDEAPDGDIGPVVPPPSAPARGRKVKLPQSD